MRYILYPYKLGSRTAKSLQAALGAIRVRPDGLYRPREDDVIINLGNSIVPTWLQAAPYIWNVPTAVSLASNKIHTFHMLSSSGVPTIEWTTDWNVASEWERVFVRHRLQGHSGEGIEVWSRGSRPLPMAPLYTKLMDNYGEYRVHVFNGEVIDYRKKSRHVDDEPTPEESLIRTNSNGWVFRQNNLRRLERIEELAITTIESLGLDFGAVDIIKNVDGDVFVLEVNSCPAMEERTLEAYTAAIKSIIE